MTAAAGGEGGRPVEGTAPLAGSVARHALLWLFAGCAVGLGLATLLAFPRLGSLLGPFTYGRFMALHLDLTLYGWIALPVVGLLLRAFAVEHSAPWKRGARIALDLWSAALVAGSLSWLAGRTSGKLFLDWSGGAKAVLLAAMAALFLLLVAAALDRRPAALAIRARGAIPVPARWLTLLLLASVPAALGAASGPDSYPAVNPASGGPTGTSLLGSSLALVLVLLALPRFAGLERVARAARFRHRDRLLFAALTVHFALYVTFASGDRPNDDPFEIVALASVLFWAVAVPLDLACFAWPEAARPWGRAAVAWGVVLAGAGFVQFLPAPLAAGKFTHLLVAHAHLAMAGFASSVAFLLLELEARAGEELGRRPLFALWQGGTLAHVIALAGVGLLEARDPAAFLRGSAAISALLALRWLAGATLLVASGLGLRRAWQGA